MSKLVFGDFKSIALRDKAIGQDAESRLLPKVKCPLCGAKNIGAFEVDSDEKVIGWNIACKPSCPNSLEYEGKDGYDEINVYTDFKGKFLDYQGDCDGL